MSKQSATSFTGAVDLGSNKVTSLANGTVSSDAAAFGQVPTSAASIGGLLASNNLSDVGSAATTRTNLGVAIGTNVQAHDATLDSLASYNTNGVLVQTAADTFAGRTLTGTSNQVTVTNGDGVAGNPTLALPQSIHTGATPQFTQVGAGAAPSHALHSTLVYNGSNNPVKALWAEITGQGTNTATTIGVFNLAGTGGQNPQVVLSSNGTNGMMLKHANAFKEGMLDHNWTSATKMSLGLRGIDRIAACTSKTLTNAATSLFEIALPTLQMAGGQVNWTIDATDGTDMQNYSGITTFSAINKAGVYTTQVTQNASNESKAVSAGTLTASFSLLTGTNKVTMQVTPATSLTTTTYRITFTITNNSAQAITVL